MESEEQTTDLVAQPLQTPVSFNPEKDIEDGRRAAKVLMSIVKPVLIGGKKYLRFEDWQTLAKFYNVTVGIEWTKRIDEDGVQGFGARAVVYGPTGNILSAAENQCTRAEKTWANRDDYALRSMAQTRAQAKALRNVLSWVAVLAGAEATPAEEMPIEAPTQPKLSPIEEMKLEPPFTTDEPWKTKKFSAQIESEKKRTTIGKCRTCNTTFDTEGFKTQCLACYRNDHR